MNSPKKSERTVGVEIECLTKRYTDKVSLKHAGLCDIVGDGSIDGDGYGLEVVTNALTLTAQETNIKGIAKELAQQEAFTNVSCGLHVHVHAPELSLDSFVSDYHGGARRITPSKLVYIHRSAFKDFYGEAEAMQARVADIVLSEDSYDVTSSYGGGRMYKASKSFRGDNLTMLPTGQYQIPDTHLGDFHLYEVDMDALSPFRFRMHSVMHWLSAVDPILRSLLPSTRRHNTYCRPFEKVARHGGAMPEYIETILQGITGRYCGINLEAIEKHGTIEIRYHGGTVQGDKIIHWMRLCHAIVHRACAMNDSRGRVGGYINTEYPLETDADTLMEVLNGKNRLEILLEMLELPEDTQKYLMERYIAFMGSDARHTIAMLKKMRAQKARLNAFNARVSITSTPSQTN